MKIEWCFTRGPNPSHPDLDLFFDGEAMAFLRTDGDWLTARFLGVDDNKFPDGARFEVKRVRAAKNFLLKHTTVLWIGRSHEN